MVLAGLGWGGMPEANVRPDIGAGRLVHFDLPSWRGGQYPLTAVNRMASSPGPAERWLIQQPANIGAAPH